jgi:RimJ/RimL family protein N-acetyltransferase
MVTPFTTKRTRIRLATSDDAAFVTAIENNVDLKQLVGGPSGRSEESYRNVLSATGDLSFLIVESLATGLPIGLCGLLTGSLSDDCEVRVILCKEYWGRGLGTEIAKAMKELAADIFPNKVLTAKAHPDNTASLKIISKLGLAAEDLLSSKSYEGWLGFRAPLPIKPSNQAFHGTAPRSDA